MTLVEAIPLVTAATAVTALDLSLFNTIDQQRSKARNLEVSLSLGLVTGPRVQGALLLRAGNRSSRPGR
jgi:hypothetical protein